ncbi:MAG: S-layer homology domain-containing protein, partial [Syntrophomonadaceae bacterium]|nr:S-layer homology domain-containing protein [Syntrophomonadaceae bacterium]
IVSGIGDNKFAPDAEITRQDLAAIITRYAEYANKQFPATRQFVTFADDAQIADYAKNDVQTLYNGGIISGKPNLSPEGGNVFDPRGSATRAEVAAMLHRFIEAAK